MKFSVQIEREVDGRWIAEVFELPGVLVHGDSEAQAQAKAQALRVLADRWNTARPCSRPPELKQEFELALQWGEAHHDGTA